jgi:hypothetical protein
MRLTPDLAAARADLEELAGHYLLVLDRNNRAQLDRQGAAIERRWHGRDVYVVCDRRQALALGRPAALLDAMDEAKMRDESKLAREELR